VKSERPRLWPYLILPGIYFLLVASGPLYSWYSTTVPVIGANIGYGLGFMWTAVWGMPWSIWPWTNPPGTDMAEVAAYVGCGLLNVALLVGIMLWLRRKAARFEDAPVEA
jgi:hypothetical protein